MWLSVPVVTAGRPRFQVLRDVEVCRRTDWPAAHLRLFREHYLRTPFYGEVSEVIEPVYQRDHRYLVDFSVDLTAALLGYLGSTTVIRRAGGLPHGGDRTQRLIDLTRAVRADTHITSSYQRAAIGIDWVRVAAAGITVRSQEFSHPVYGQLHGPFVPGLSVLDLLCNHGTASADLLRSARRLPVARPADTGDGSPARPEIAADAAVDLLPEPPPGRHAPESGDGSGPPDRLTGPGPVQRTGAGR